MAIYRKCRRLSALILFLFNYVFAANVPAPIVEATATALAVPICNTQSVVSSSALPLPDLSANAQHKISFSSKHMLPEHVSSVKETNILWLWQRHVDSGAEQPLQPAIDKNRVYVNDAHGHLLALAVANGNILWRQAVPKALSVGVAVDHCALLLGSGQAQLMAFAPASGKLLWQQALPSVALQPAVVLAQHAYVTTLNGMLYAFSTCSGHLSWVARHAVPEQTVWATPPAAIYSPYLAVGFNDASLALYNNSTGQQLWQRDINAPKLAALNSAVNLQLAEQGTLSASANTKITAVQTLIDAQTVYTLTSVGLLQARSIKSGDLLWQNQVPANSTISQNKNSLYLLDKSSHLSAYSKNAGLLLWDNNMPADFFDSFVVTPKVLFVTGKKGAWRLLQANSGKTYAHGFFQHSSMKVAHVACTWVLHNKHGWLGVLQLQGEDLC